MGCILFFGKNVVGVKLGITFMLDFGEVFKKKYLGFRIKIQPTFWGITKQLKVVYFSSPLVICITVGVEIIIGKPNNEQT